MCVCVSAILYELLYDRVFHMDRSALTSSLRMSKVPSETIITEERESSGNSDLDEGEDFWCVCVCVCGAAVTT